MYCVKIRQEDQEMLKRNRVIEWSYWNIQVLKYSAKRIRVKCNEDSRWKCEEGANSEGNVDKLKGIFFQWIWLKIF